MQPNEIRAALILKGITGVSIARSLGVPQQNVAAVIALTRRTPRIRQAIAAAIGKPVAEVFPDHKEAV